MSQLVYLRDPLIELRYQQLNEIGQIKARRAISYLVDKANTDNCILKLQCA